MPLSVLIADDNEQDLTILRYNFERHGYRVLKASNGREALELAVSERPDLIISDVLMPEMDGFQLLREVMKLPNLRDIPLIFYSCIYTGNREKELALALGARAFIVKPLTPDQLWEDISRSLSTQPPLSVLNDSISSSDESFLTDYSRIVATKLEEKVRELEVGKQRLALTESRYRNMFASIRDVVIITDLSRTIIDCNQPALQAVFGYQTDEVVGKSSSLLYADPAQFELAGKEVFNHHDASVGMLLNLKFQRKSGEEFDGEIFALKMIGDDGNPVGNIGVIRDVTEAKRSSAELARSEAKFRQLSQEFNGLLDAIPDSIMLFDRDLKVLWANRYAAESIGCASDQMTGFHCHSLCCERPLHCEPCPVLRCIESGSQQSETVSASDGRIWDIRTVPLINEHGDLMKVIAVKHEMTEYKKLEAQYLHAQKMDSIGTLTGGVAHDFNNILMVILGLGQMTLHKMADNDLQRHNIEGILEAANKAALLTRELLLFSRKQQSERRSVDLRRVVGKMETFLQRIIGEDITLTLVSQAQPLPVLADHNQLEQVLMNLAVNARDALPNGGLFLLNLERVELSEEVVAIHGPGRPGPYALLSVSDDGTGMDRETVRRIFEPFFSTKEVGKGTGLGLSVVYGIVKQHEGFITVYSEPGNGSTFRIYLPLCADAVAVPEAVPLRETVIPTGSETILLAEDNDQVRELLNSVLSEAGYRVIVAVDGEQAVSKFREHADSIELLLFDMIMPKMNGKEASDAIHKLKSGVKTIFASGYAADIVRHKAAPDDGSIFLSKPVSPHALITTVRSVLDGAPPAPGAAHLAQGR